MTKMHVSEYFSSEIPMRIALLIPTLCLLGIVMILAVIAPATGYEVSIYHEYPFILWILFGLLYLFPFLYLLLTANKTFGLNFRKQHINYILTIALCGTLLLLSLPLIRGYYCNTGGDIFTHMGTVIDILNGSASLMINHYPASMVEVSMLNLLSGVAVNQIILCAIQWTVLLFVLGMFCLSRRFCTNYTQVVVITALSIIPILGNFFTQEIFMPSTIGWALLPMLFFCAYCVATKTLGQNQFLIVACILSIGLWYIHSEAIVFGGITLMLALFFILFWPFQRGVLRELNYKGLIVIITVLVLGAIFLITYTGIFSEQVLDYFNLLFGESGSVSTKSPLGKLNDYPLFETIVLAMMNFGQLIIISVCSILLLFYQLIKVKRISSWNFKYAVLATLFIGIGIVCVWYIITGNDIGMFIYRVFKYQLIFCILVIGCLAAIKPMIIGNKQKVIKIVSILLIILIVCFSLVSTYNSPYLAKTPGFHITYSDMHGMEVFFTVQDPSNGISETRTRDHINRYGKAIWGSYFSAENVIGTSSKTFRIPDNFNVNYASPSSDYFNKDTYLLYYPPNLEFDVINIIKNELKGFSSVSSHHLRFDNSVEKVIDLGPDFSVYLIHV
ncbi:MAG: hypothetical protein IJB12_03675 [Methanocorpusculum sp.]|nr:hypothetical protein [Methanocorpusculum sp.]